MMSSERQVPVKFDPGLLIGIALVVVALIVSAVATYRNLDRLYEDTKMVSHTHDVVYCLQKVLSYAVDAETGQRGFLISGETQYLEPYNAAVKSIDLEIKQLRKLTLDNPRQQSQLPQLEKQIAARLNLLAELIDLRQQQGFEAARVQVLSDRGKKLMDELRRQIAEMAQVEQQLMKQRTERAAKSYRIAVGTSVVTTLLGLAAVGAFVYMLGRALSIRAIAAGALYHERELLQVTLRSIGDGVITTDTSGNVTSLNGVAESMTGWQTSEARGTSLESVFNIVSEETRAKVENPAFRALAEGCIVGLANHTILISKDGSERAIANSAAPIVGQDSALLGSVLVFRDVSEDWTAERALFRSEALKTAILNSALDAVITCDQDGRVVEFNPAAERIFGYSRAESLGKDLGELIVPPALRSQHRGGMASYLQTGVSKILNARLELPALRKDSTEFPAEITVTRIAGTGPAMFTAYLRDITDRKTSESALRDARDQLELRVTERTTELANTTRFLQAILENIQEGIVACNAEGVLTLFNRATREFHGVPLELLAAEAWASHYDLFQADGVTPLRMDDVPLYRALQGHRVHYMEMVIAPKQGERRILLASGQALYDDKGQKLGAVVSMHDITQRKKDQEALQRAHDELEDRVRERTVELTQANQDLSSEVRTRQLVEESLRSSAERLRMALNVARMVAWERDSEVGQTVFSDNAAEVLGWPTSGPLTQSVMDLKIIHPEDRARYQSVISQAHAKMENYVVQYRIVHFDRDQTLWMEERGKRIENNHDSDSAAHATVGISSGPRLIGTIMDITERKESERELRLLQEESDRQRRVYATILSTTPDFVYVFNLDHQFSYINDSLLAMWGKSLDEALGKTCLELGYADWHAEMHNREIDTVVATKQPIRGEVPFTGTSGRRIYDYIFAPVFSVEGEVEAVAGTTRDVTDRKQLEEHLREVAADLSEANRRKNEFLATLAHELRNPMAPIRTGLEVMKRAAEDKTLVAETRSMMERQVQQMVRLIDDLLDVARITQGKLELRKSRITLSDAINSAVEATRPFIDEAGHELVIEIPALPVYLDADSNRLAQVISNLLSNAAKYTPNGGNIWLTAQRQGNDIGISVKDTGMGIPADMAGRIFEMFTQIDRPLEKGYKGLGIGLTLVKRLVEMHGGTISVHSAGTNQGSEFTVSLPTLIDQEDGNPPGVKKEEEQLKVTRPLKILVVDDNEAAAEMLAMVLKIMGHETFLAFDGVEAVEVAEKILPELVFMDLGMPKLNGYEAAQEIRRRDWGQKMTLVALTGWGQEEDKQRTVAAGFNFHLIKPVEPEAVQQLIESLV